MAASIWFREPLILIINLAFEQERVPKFWNFSLVKPIPKKTSVSLDDFRPMSLICNTLKVADEENIFPPGTIQISKKFRYIYTSHFLG